LPASASATRSRYEEIAREMLAEADAVAAAEEEHFGERRGDELPPELATAQGRRGWLLRQGAGLQRPAVCSERQIVIAAEVTVDSPDFGHLGPMVEATGRELAAARITDAPEVVLADAGYWHQAQMETLTGGGTVVLIPPDAGKRKGARPGWDGGLYALMRRVLASDPARRALRQTPGHDRTGLRAHQVQPPDGPLPTPRQISRPVRVAAHDRDSQPPQAPQAHHRAAGGLSRPIASAAAGPGVSARTHALTSVSPEALGHQALRNSHTRKRASIPPATC
jgi:hypothetical protein